MASHLCNSWFARNIFSLVNQAIDKEPVRRNIFDNDSSSIDKTSLISFLDNNKKTFQLLLHIHLVVWFFMVFNLDPEH